MDETALAGLAAEEADMVVEALREALQRHLSDEAILALDAQGVFPEAVVRDLLSPDVGMHLIFLPEEAGGLGGGARDICRVSEEMAAVDLSVATAFLAICLGTEPILVGGTPSQKDLWLKRIADEGMIVAYAVTEPGAGSNVAGLQATAEPVLDKDGGVTAYRLNGTKQFITNGGVADLYTILVRAPEGPTFFIVERDTAGLLPGKKEAKHGIRASDTTSLTLEDVVVPAENLIGGLGGEGLKQASAVFGYTRLMVAAFGLGAGWGALKRAVEYARERVQFSTPLIEKEGFTLKLLATPYVELEAGRAYVEATALRIDQSDGDLQVEGAIAKYWCTEAGNRAADAALQAHGGYGYMTEYMVEKFRRDVRITSIYEGTSEILQSVIGINRWKAQIKSKGAYYAKMAEVQDALHVERGGLGADLVARAARDLGDVISHSHRLRATRHQMVLFTLADMVTYVEIAAAFCQKAADLAAASDPRATVVAAMSRVHARSTLMAIERKGRLCAVGFATPGDEAALAVASDLVTRLDGGLELAALAGHWQDLALVGTYLAEQVH